MGKFLNVLLRFGPLVAGAALGLAAVLEPLVPGYTGVVNTVLAGLGFLGVSPNKELVDLVSNGAAGVMVLIGVARKIFSLVTKPATPPPA